MINIKQKKIMAKSTLKLPDKKGHYFEDLLACHFFLGLVKSRELIDFKFGLELQV